MTDKPTPPCPDCPDFQPDSIWHLRQHLDDEHGIDPLVPLRGERSVTADLDQPVGEEDR